MGFYGSRDRSGRSGHAVVAMLAWGWVSDRLSVLRESQLWRDKSWQAYRRNRALQKGVNPFARHHGINRSQSNTILTGRRVVGAAIAELFGLRKAYVVK